MVLPLITNIEVYAGDGSQVKPSAMGSTNDLWPYVLGIGVTATGGQLLMTQAYAEDRAAVVAAASYTTPLWGVIADLLIFDLIPGSLAIVGGVIIVAAGLVLIFAREQPVTEEP